MHSLCISFCSQQTQIKSLNILSISFWKYAQSHVHGSTFNKLSFPDRRKQTEKVCICRNADSLMAQVVWSMFAQAYEWKISKSNKKYSKTSAKITATQTHKVGSMLKSQDGKSYFVIKHHFWKAINANMLWCQHNGVVTVAVSES